MWRDVIPSRFVELPRDHIERASDVAGFGAGGEKPSVAFRRDARRLRAMAGGSIACGAVVPVRSSTCRRARSPAAAPTIRAGARVFHQKFGYGEVISVDGDKLDIDFDKAAPKKVMAGFVVPAEQAR